ncbi:CBS domain-containing protein [Tunicatimonas pelagia]|uniref:CBS domain-containing protein n=1 Tax=Tunicatimonas pelagia TaxID=931531 RepID=UPI002666A73D|nr:CBS domain-containing protein [Tunicatimonas pelagia]WKN43498.1 CBS domain-containing protein [Tunicatimonas pelagia]
MVKSYRGIAQDTATVPKLPSLVVADYMATHLITFTPDQTIQEVVRTLLAKRISGAPVVNEQRELIGVISEGDCLKEVVKGKYDNLPIFSGKVRDHMSSRVVSINADTNIFEAANMFLNRHIRRFPVLREGKLVGQVSQKDVMKAVLKLKSATWR